MNIFIIHFISIIQLVTAQFKNSCLLILRGGCKVILGNVGNWLTSATDELQIVISTILNISVKKKGSCFISSF